MSYSMNMRLVEGEHIYLPVLVIQTKTSSNVLIVSLIPIIDSFFSSVSDYNLDIMMEYKDNMGELTLVDAVLILPYYLHPSGDEFVDKINQEVDVMIRNYVSTNYSKIPSRMASHKGVHRSIVIKKFYPMQNNNTCCVM